MKKRICLSCEKIFILLLLLTTAGRGYAQHKEAADMTPAEMEAFDIQRHQEWERALSRQRIELPALPTMADDRSKPPGLKQRRAGSSSWTDTAGNNYGRSAWGHWTNYDEASAARYTLHDPLVLKNGQRVKNAATWWKERRPEILKDYDDEIYGHIPAHTPPIHYEVVTTDSGALGGRAIKKVIVGHIDNARYPAATPSIRIVLYLPAGVKTPVPLMVSPCRMMAHIDVDAMTPALGMLIAKGWAFGMVNTNAIQNDDGPGLLEGIIGLVNEGKLRQPSDWGVLAAWSWGLSRALDYLETEPLINKKQIGIEGHSRWGKTALLAAAMDTRWSVVYASCSGSMGASLEKRNYGETVDNVAGESEYHWMAESFLKYGGHPEAMPVDAHELIALIAPRPVFITGGTKDSWADPKGEFLACAAAGPVYRLLGKKDMGTSVMPAPDAGLMSGDLAFRLHEGGHTDMPDWPVFIDFAERHWKQ
jgi:hypothetical protein